MQIQAYKQIDKDQVLQLLKLNNPQYFDESEESDLRNYPDRLCRE